MYKRFLFFVVLILIAASSLRSQTFDQTLSRYYKATQTLNEINKIDNILDDTYNINELLNEMRSIMSSFSALNKVQDSYRLASGYYSVLSMQKLAEIYDVNLELEKAYETLKKVQPYVNGQINIPTPIYYSYNGSSYQITADNLLALKNEYYKLLQYACYFLNKNDELKQAVNAQINLNSDYYSIARGIGYLIRLQNEKNINLTADEKILYYANYLKSIGGMPDNDLAKLASDKKYVHWNQAAKDLLKLLKSATPTPASNTQTVLAIYALSQKNLYSAELLDLIDYSLTNFSLTTDYSGNQWISGTNIEPFAYLSATEKTAYNAMNDVKAEKNNLDLAMNILNYSLSKEKAHKVAQTSLTKMGDLSVSKNNCEKIKLATEKLKAWGFETEYAKYNALIIPCELAVQKEKERKEKEYKRANSKLNIYLGAYPLGLLTKTDKMDFGAALNIVHANKNAFEFSFLNIQKKRDNYFDIWMMEKKYNAEDLSYWDGFYSHFQYKIFNKNTPKLYNGILLGYANKNFESMTVTTINNQTNAEQQETFDPTMRQAIIMLNEGYMSLYKGYGVDLYFGVGATFNKFNRGNTTFDSSTHTVKDNNVLQYRKDQYISFIMRFGITIGLNIGNGNQ